MATGKVISKTAVYYGPSTSYPSDNSYAGPNDSVTILWSEGLWYYIEYPAGSKRKRMYIRKSAVSQVSGSVSTYYVNKQARYCNYGTDTYCGPSSSKYANAGSISEGEKVYYLYSKKENNYALIEYNVSGGKQKRAWVDSMKLCISPPPVVETKFFDYLANGWVLTLGWNKGNSYPGHLGNDLKGLNEVQAIATGIVKDKSSYCTTYNGYTLLIEHTLKKNNIEKKFYSFYAHMDEKVKLNIGQEVEARQKLCEVGNSGQSTGKHVHLGVYVGSKSTNLQGHYRKEPKPGQKKGDMSKFNDYGKGFIDYAGRRFYDPQKVIATKGDIIFNNYE